MKNVSTNLIECESKIQYHFNNQSLLKQALTHSSCSNTHIESNERLEFLGDSTLGFVISDLLFKQFPLMAEGDLSKLKATIVSRKTCKKVATRLELNRFLFIGKGLTSIPDSLIANVMESVIGAIYLDGGYENVRSFIENNFQQEIDSFFAPSVNSNSSLFSSENHETTNKTLIKANVNSLDILLYSLDDNFKAKLQTKIHHDFPTLTPEYLLLDEKGPARNRCFKIAVKIGERQFQAAWGMSKKATEQRAAENAICQLQGIAPPHSDGE